MPTVCFKSSPLLCSLWRSWVFNVLCCTDTGRDIIQKLILEGVTHKKAFQWQSQLKQRYVNGEAKLAIADARFDYKFEYLGEL